MQFYTFNVDADAEKRKRSVRMDLKDSKHLQIEH